VTEVSLLQLELPFQFKEVLLFSFNGQETTTLEDSFELPGHQRANLTLTLLSMLEFK